MKKRKALRVFVASFVLVLLFGGYWIWSGKLHPTPDAFSPTGFYIPKDLDDCHRELDKMLSFRVRTQIKYGGSRSGAHYLFGFGMWMRNQGGLWSGSRLATYFHGIGLNHPDDMSGVILSSYASKLKGKDYDLEGRVSHYQLYWKRVEKPSESIEEETGQVLGITESEAVIHLKDGRAIHVGENKETKEVWYYEFEKGWYRPTSEDFEYIEEHGMGVSSRLWVSKV